MFWLVLVFILLIIWGAGLMAYAVCKIKPRRQNPSMNHKYFKTFGWGVLLLVIAAIYFIALIFYFLVNGGVSFG